MKNIKQLFSVAFLVAFLTGGVFAQQQGAQTLNTTTLAAAVTTTYGNTVKLTSTSNVLNTVSAQTVLYVDTEAMTVASGTAVTNGYVTVTRGSNGTKAETHASGAQVYVGRPNLFQNYDVAGSCTSGSGLAATLPWINLSSGNRFQCYSDGVWFRSGRGSQFSGTIAVATAFCTTTLSSGATAYLNGTACASSSTATFRYVVQAPGELANLRVYSSASETAAAGDPVTVYKNGSSTAITCTILQNAATCSDSTHGVQVAAGDTLTFNVTGATSAAAANLAASVGIYTQ